MTLYLMHYISHYCITECFEINYRHTPSLLKYIFQVVYSCSHIWCYHHTVDTAGSIVICCTAPILQQADYSLLVQL